MPSRAACGKASLLRTDWEKTGWQRKKVDHFGAENLETRWHFKNPFLTLPIKAMHAQTVRQVPQSLPPGLGEGIQSYVLCTLNDTLDAIRSFFRDMSTKSMSFSPTNRFFVTLDGRGICRKEKISTF